MVVNGIRNPGGGGMRRAGMRKGGEGREREEERESTMRDGRCGSGNESLTRVT